MFSIETLFKFTFSYVKISQTDTETVSFTKNFFKIVFLHVPQNRIVDICDILSFNDSLEDFDVSNNEVSRVTKHCFQDMIGLSRMNLENNSIQEIQDNAFKFLPTLNVVNLSNNLINEIEFSLLRNALLLDLINNPVIFLSSKTFYLAKTEIIVTNDYHVCCIAPSVISYNAFRPWYSSCLKLLPNSTMAIVPMKVVLFIFVLNISSIIGHLKFKNIQAVNLMIIFVNSSDLVYGFMLVILLAGNYAYHETFVAFERAWRSSIPCYIIFIFSVLFSVMSTVGLCFISGCKLMIVMLPLCLKVRSKYFIGKTLITAVIFILAISTTTDILYKETETFLTTSLCSPFIDPSSSIFLIKFLTIGIGILQLSASVFICLIYAVLIIILHRTQRTSQLV